MNFEAYIPKKPESISPRVSFRSLSNLQGAVEAPLPEVIHAAWNKEDGKPVFASVKP